ncbi:Endo-beta-1 4-glucanase D [Ceratocystis lukuohia]|uniref:lytic cellulose monooxygenase (C4-dehydrogenating) n=1 Tax=Ceratocystis lukuohia TaxID=2019550 RepID=A0ABR4MQM4_9PEZI
MKTFATIVASASLVAAQGYMTGCSIGNQNFKFSNVSSTDSYSNVNADRISRYTTGSTGVKDVTSLDMQCGATGGKGTQGAPESAKVAAGESVQMHWSKWTKVNKGPTVTYMAKCPDAGCQDYVPGTDAVWFKIQEAGPTASGQWPSTSLGTSGSQDTYTIPECLASGNYLVRHEAISLGGSAQFYIGCHQLEVSGSGTTNPTDLVSFPGAYKSSDSGIKFDPNTMPPSSYTVPGPSVFTCGGSSGSTPSAAGSSSGPKPSTGPSSAVSSNSPVGPSNVPMGTGNTPKVTGNLPKGTGNVPLGTGSVGSNGGSATTPASGYQTVASVSGSASAAATTPAPGGEYGAEDVSSVPARGTGSATSASSPVTTSGPEDTEDCPVENDSVPASPTSSRVPLSGTNSTIPDGGSTTVGSSPLTTGSTGSGSGSDYESGDDECPVEDGETTPAGSATTASSPASTGAGSTTPVESDDECPADDSEETTSNSSPTTPETKTPSGSSPSSSGSNTPSGSSPSSYGSKTPSGSSPSTSDSKTPSGSSPSTSDSKTPTSSSPSSSSSSSSTGSDSYSTSNTESTSTNTGKNSYSTESGYGSGTAPPLLPRLSLLKPLPLPPPENDDECPAEDEEPVEEDDECPAEEDEPATTSPVETQNDDECPADEDEETTSNSSPTTPTTTEENDDECPVDEDEPTTTTPTSPSSTSGSASTSGTSTSSASPETEEECPVEYERDLSYVEENLPRRHWDRRSW